MFHKKIKSLSKNKAARNSLWIIIEQTFSVGVTAVITIIAARYLGAENYGILSYGLTFVTLFGAIAKLGIDSILVNELIRNKKQQGAILGTSVAVRIFASILSILLMAILLSIINHGQKVLIIVALIQSILLIFQSGYVFDYWFQSKLESKYVSIAKISATIATSAYGVYILLTSANLILFAWSTALGSILISILLIVFYLRRKGQPLKYSSAIARDLISKSYHFMLAAIAAVIYIQIDKVMIGNMIGNSQLGFYSAALTLCAAWSFLPNAITTSMRPAIFEAKLKSEERYIKRLKQLYFIIFWLSVAVSALITTLAPWLITLLFGEGYTSSIIVTQIAVWYMPLSILGTARGIWIVAENKNKYVKYYLSIGLITNIALNIILIPTLGIVGAAISTVATEIVTGFIAPLIYRETRMYPKLALQAIFYRV